MFKVKVIQVCRNKSGRIQGYLIADERNKRGQITSQELKDAIRQNKVSCTNYTLTSDGRLMPHKDTSVKQAKKVSSNKSNNCEHSIDIEILKNIIIKSGYKIDNESIDDEEREVSSIPKGVLNITLTVSGYNNGEIGIFITLGESNFEYEVCNTVSNANNIIAEIKNITNTLDKPKTASEALELIDFIASNDGECQEIALDYAYYTVAEKFNIKEQLNNAMQDRINKVLANKNIMGNLQAAVLNDINEFKEQASNIRILTLMHQKVLSVALCKDTYKYNCVMLACESTIKEKFNFIKPGTRLITEDEIEEAVNMGYNEYKKLSDKFINTILDIGGTFWRLDTALYEGIGSTLAETNSSFTRSSDGTYTLDDAFTDVTTEKFYTALVEVIRVYKDDYQYPLFRSVFLNNINGE